MPTRRAFLLAALVAGGTAVVGGLGVSALSGEEATSAEPIIRLGAETCAACGMPIDDRRWLAAWRSGGKELHFDDIGCMVDAARKRSLPATATLFVNDFAAGSWTDGAAAHYVVSPAYKTPMAYGVAAFASSDQAESAAAQNNARTWTWSDLLQRLEGKS